MFRWGGVSVRRWKRWFRCREGRTSRRAEAGTPYRILIVRAEPADEAALFLGGALVVEGDEAGEKFVACLLLSCVLCLAVLCLDLQGRSSHRLPTRRHRGRRGSAEDGDEALVVDLLFLGGERLRRRGAFRARCRCR